MQVNTRLGHDAQVARMATLQRDLDRAQDSIATGKRIGRPSDDPVGAGIALRLHRVRAEGVARIAAVAGAGGRLAATDTALGRAATVLQRARELALQGATGTLNAQDRATLAAEAGELGKQLLGLANATGSDGAPLFGAASGTAPAFARDAGGRVAWTGVGGAAVVALDSPTPAAADGVAAFVGADADAFALLDDLHAALGAPDATRAGDLARVLDGLDAATGRVADAQAVVGARAARLDAEAERLKADDLGLAADLSRLEDTDTAAAIARLQRLSTVLQATQASFVKLASLSLWDRL